MPNIELHGYGTGAAHMRQKLVETLKTSPDADELVTTIVPDDVEDLTGKKSPFLRLFASPGHFDGVLGLLSSLGEDIEVIFLGKWVPKQADGNKTSENEECLNMHPLVFYTEDRLHSTGCHRRTARDARRLIGFAHMDPPSKDGKPAAPLETVRAFRDHYSGSTVLFKRFNTCRDRVRVTILQVTNDAGILFKK